MSSKTQLLPLVYDFLVKSNYKKAAARLAKDCKDAEVKKSLDVSLEDVYKTYSKGVGKKRKRESSSESSEEESEGEIQLIKKRKTLKTQKNGKKKKESNKNENKKATKTKKKDGKKSSKADSKDKAKSVKKQKQEEKKKAKEEKRKAKEEKKKLKKQKKALKEGKKAKKDKKTKKEAAVEESSKIEDDSDVADNNANISGGDENHMNDGEQSPAQQNIEDNSRQGNQIQNRFQRINIEKELAEIKDERLKDNTYRGTFGNDGWGAKASEILLKVRGKGFRHEKTKKKRGGYRGGLIDDTAVRSIKFNYDSN